MEVLTMRLWLRKANGWKRIWFILTCLGIILSILPMPIYLMADNNRSSRKFERKTIEALALPECFEYAIMPLKELTWPDVGDSCYYVYSHRYSNQDKNDLPLTAEKVRKNVQSKIWNDYLLIMFFFLVGTVACSLVLYFLGFLPGWVFAGFKKNGS